MATEDIVGSLFGVNPAMYQQQQQKQVFDRAVALQNLNPFQQAAVGYQQAGYNLAGALGGALGGVDPQLQRISALNAISKQIDQSNPESMMNGAKMLADAGFTQEALGLANYARKANSELALAEQRRKEGRAATTTKEIQNAEYAANLRVVLGELESGPQTADTPRQIALLKARLEGLPQTKEASTTTDAIRNAEYSANILVELDKLQKEEPTPEIENQIALLNARLKAMPQQKDAAVSANIQDSLEIGRLVGEIDKLNKLPEDLKDLTKIKQLEAQLLSLAKNTKPSEFGQILQDAGYIPGSEDYKTKMKEFANLKLTKEPETKTEAMKNAIAFADASPYKKGTPEYNKVYLDKFTELTGKADKADRAPPSVGGDAERISQTLYGKRFSELSQAEAAIVDKEVERRDLAAKKATAASIKVEIPSAQKQEGAFSTETGKLDAQVLADTRASAIAAAQALSSIASMKQLDKTGQLVTGPLANSYVGASNLLASIGLLSPNQVSILTSSQVYDKSAKDLVMQDLGGKLGAQISDTDRKFVEDRIPQLTTSAKARTELLDKIEQIQKGKVEYFRKMKAHANKYRNLDEFDFSEVYTVIPAAGSSAATATKAKADAIIKGKQ